MRLDKFLCHTTGMTRTQAQRAVRNGTVTVNGIISKKTDTQLAPSDAVQMDNQTLLLPQPRYFMLHKPAGYICANSDGNHPVALDLLQEKLRENLQIAGRLDIDTTGLVLITDDGAWNHRITAPSRQCHKEYRAKLQAPLTAEAETRLKNGVMLDGEKKSTLPAQIVLLNSERTEILLTIHEGKYHQVKRMLTAVGNHVQALHRTRIGNIALDPALAPGQYRALTAQEISCT